MNTLTALHTVDQCSRIAEHDPHGIIISIVSISIVFMSLIILYLAYELIGIMVNSWFVKNKEGRSGREDNLKTSGHEIHDKESYTITINRKGVQAPKTVDRGTRLNICIAADDEMTVMHNRSITSADGIVRSPLPGTILRLPVKEGEKVEAGQAVAILEAMKMENTIEAERAGTVTKIHVSQGDSIPEGGEIMTIE